jgi:hypothetical protein
MWPPAPAQRLPAPRSRPGAQEERARAGARRRRLGRTIDRQASTCFLRANRVDIGPVERPSRRGRTPRAIGR